MPTPAQPPQPASTTPTPHADARHAFTLVELLVVVVIITILISILLPAISGARNTARAASTKSFMSSISTSIGQFRAAEQRMPGYFTVKEVGDVNNWIQKTDQNGIVGLTYLENALLDLAGGVYEDQDASATDNYNDPTQPPDIIRVGIGAGREVNVQRTAIGRDGGPGYLDVPDGFVDMGKFEDGRAGKWIGHHWMPRLIDSWGMPILMWPRDEFAKNSQPLVYGVYEATNPQSSAPFYWAGNSSFTNADRLGKGTQKSQRDGSTLASNPAGALRNPRGSTGPLAQSLAAVVGNPAFPDANSLSLDSGPVPDQPRGDVVLESAGPDGIYLEDKGDKFDQYHYVPNGYDFKAWQAGEKTNYIENSDDLIAGGS